MHYVSFKEHRHHGTESFPLEYYMVDESHPRYVMAYHWHRETELLRILRGEFHLSLSGVDYLLKEGDVCYIPEGALHGGTPVNCAYECIDFNIDFLLQQASFVQNYLHTIENQQTKVQPVFSLEQPGILKCAARLFDAARDKNHGWELLVLAGLFDFYGTVIQKNFCEDSHTDNSSYQKAVQVKLALEYIAENYQRPITLDDLAKISGLSAKYFCRYFNSIVHRTPIDYLNYYRIERACILLEQGNQSVTEVAYACGYNDSSYFVRSFKKYKNITPNQYAKLGKRTKR